MFGDPTLVFGSGYHYAAAPALYLAGLAVSVALSVSRVRYRRSARRQQGLEMAVRQRTEELSRAQLRETKRSRVLEMLVSSEPLGTVLDGVAELVRTESPGTHCAILLKNSTGCHVGAAPGVPGHWLAALHYPRAVPFEVWKGACSSVAPATDPAWRIFAGSLQGPAPGAVQTCPIGSSTILGAVLLFSHETDAIRDAATLETASRLSQLAIEHSRLYEDLQFRAHHDSLTGLPNRALFEERLRQSVHDAGLLGLHIAVLMLDLDRFKEINDEMGHGPGDLYLIEIADRIRRLMRDGDTVARIGGDEFSILISNIRGLAEAEEIANHILAGIREPIMIEGRVIMATASVGVAMFPDDGTESEDLQREADAAMYCAKGLGRNRVQAFCSRNDKLDRARMLQELRTALRDGLFTVHYQPKVGAEGQFGGFEALVRLQHSTHGLIPPAEFIPVAEESGLIVQLGAWVLNEVCRQIAEWHQRGFGRVSIAVNVSPVQISRPDFAQQVQECLLRHGVAPAEIELELTEGLVISGGEESQRQMRTLRSAGIRFSIDDFGTGYSSLSYLYKLEVDAIKLDRSFVQAIDSDHAARRLVQAMIGVANGLGLNVVAEGVETEAQRLALVNAGCPMMQGYLFSQPLPAAEMERFLQVDASGTDDLHRIEHATTRLARSLLPAFQR